MKKADEQIASSDGIEWHRVSIVDEMPEAGYKFDRPLPETAEEFWGKSPEEFIANFPEGMGAEWVDRWNAREETIPKLKALFEGGDKSACVFAIFACMAFELPVPEWAKVDFLSKVKAISAYDVKSWDDAFGRLYDKGTHTATKKKHDLMRRSIFREVNLAIAAGTPIDEALFEEVGKKHGAGKTLAAELYYKEKNWHENF